MEDADKYSESVWSKKSAVPNLQSPMAGKQSENPPGRVRFQLIPDTAPGIDMILAHETR
jgi:hypothetical protein